MSVVYLSRRATFCAAHRLHSPHLDDAENRRLFGKCNHPNGHGHNYVVEVIVRGEIDPRSGIVMNLAELKHILEERVLTDFDHKNLNVDVVDFEGVNPTAENIAVAIWNRMEPSLPGGLLHEVRLHETENNVVCYRGEA